MDFLQKWPIAPLGRRDFDVETEMAEQDESAREAQRNLLIAIALIVVLAAFFGLRGVGGAVVFFGVCAAGLVAAYGVVTLVRRSIHRNFGPRQP